MHIVFVGPFGLQPKKTVSGRALPLAQALARRGHRVRLVVPPWDWPADSGRIYYEGGVQVENVLLPASLPGIAPGLIAGRLLRQVLAGRPDVVHCFKPKSYAGFAAWVLWWLKRAGLSESRLVIDTDDWEGSGGWNERSGYSRPARWLFAWQERWGLAHADAVTVASRTLESLAWSLGARRLHYLPNGVTVLPHLPRRDQARSFLALPAGAPVALICTRFVEIGPERLARLLTALVDRVSGLFVLVVGVGLRGEETCLRQSLTGQPQAERIRLAGWVERSVLPVYWAAADLALYPCEDNLLVRCKSPLRLVELMAAGLPIVAHRVGAVSEYIEDGLSGLTVEPADDVAFAESAVRLMGDDILRGHLGEQSQMRIEERFLWDKLAVRALAAYERRAGQA